MPDPTFLDLEGDWPIAYRPYGLGGSKTPVVMLHGLESHSGWFTQSAAFMAGLGHPVYAMDRRGSGVSAAPRGDCKNFRELLTDIEALANAVMPVHQRSQIHLLGHCFGAVPATAFACSQPALLRSLILATPALYTRAEPVAHEKPNILWSALSGTDQRIPVSLEPDWFTDQVEFLRFIESDPLALKDASGRLYWEALQARRFIHANEKKLTMPVMMALAGRDRICDKQKDQQFFERVPSDNKIMKTYPDAVHILEFSSEKDRFFADLADWLST